MKIATPTTRESSVDDRRPTLTFPGQPNAPEIQLQGGHTGRWLLLLAVIIIAAGAAAYWVLTLR
jgi:uncharacterized protein HemX